jgi:hypothetical protein
LNHRSILPRPARLLKIRVASGRKGAEDGGRMSARPPGASDVCVKATIIRNPLQLVH